MNFPEDYKNKTDISFGSQTILANEQAGCRKDNSPIHQVVRPIQDIKENFNNRKYKLAPFIDFKGERNLMLNMIQQGITGHMLNWVHAFLTQ